MTMENFAFREPAEPIVFTAEIPILERIPVAWNGRSISRFGDPVWDLSPLMDEATDEPVRLHFEAAPENFRESLKRLMYCLINRPLPTRHPPPPHQSARRPSPPDLPQALARSHRFRTSA